jgi:hypothetical protein
MLVRYEDSEPVYPTSTGLSISTIGFWPREKHTLPTDAQSGTVISVEHSATEPINLDPAFGRRKSVENRSRFRMDASQHYHCSRRKQTQETAMRNPICKKTTLKYNGGIVLTTKNQQTATPLDITPHHITSQTASQPHYASSATPSGHPPSSSSTHPPPPSPSSPASTQPPRPRP